MPMMLEDLFFTFVIALGIVYALAGAFGGFFSGKGVPVPRPRPSLSGWGAAVAGVLVTAMMLIDLRMAPEAALLYPILAAGIGGYLLGRYLERREEEE
jgi:hypothetical protein